MGTSEVIICVFVIFMIVRDVLISDNKDINKVNRRIDGLHERIDNLRDMIMQRQENDIRELKNGR